MINQYIPEKQYQQSLDVKKIFFILLIIVVVIIAVVAIYEIFMQPKGVCGNDVCESAENQRSCCIDCGCPSGKECRNNVCVSPQSICGNGICENGENCYDCPKDCKCKDNEYCSEQTKKCISPQCGNGKCEPFESSENCCDDCICDITGELCNTTTHKCEMPIVEISDEKIRELVTSFYSNQGKGVISTDVQGAIEWQGKIGKKVVVNITNQEWFSVVLVTEIGEVIEIPVT